MAVYIQIKNLRLLRFISTVLPLKHKLVFLIKKYLVNGKDLAIRYFNNWFICTSVNDINRITVSEIILEGANSQPEIALIKTLQADLPTGMVMVDIGGNIGTFFCQFLHKCEHVYVFEPIPRLNTVIKKSIAFNKADKIKVIEKAVGDKPGVVTMPDNNNSSIGGTDTRQEMLEIPITTLDDELRDLRKIDFMKIDVEGYELNVLDGARDIILKHRPVILVEVHPIYLEAYKQDPLMVISFFRENNYSIKYYSFLVEQRMHRFGRIFSRWLGNKGRQFKNEQEFLEDVSKEPRLASYHFYCEPI